MTDKNGRLIAVIAAVAVAAVPIGGAFAYQQKPEDRNTTAAPLPVLSSTPAKTATPAPTSASTPAPPSKGTPPPSTRTSGPRSTAATTAEPPASSTSTSTGPTTIEVAVSKLPGGRKPQVPYLVGREVRGGPGYSLKVPGSAGIVDIARLNTDVLAVVSTDGVSELLKIDFSGVSRKTPGVSSLVTTADHSAAAYAASKLSRFGGGRIVKGGVVYAESRDSVRSLELPNSWEAEVLAYRDAKVYFRAGDSEQGVRKLYAWKPGSTKATAVPTVNSPTAIADDGSVAASMNLVSDAGTCSTVTTIATGKQLWRTCENQLHGFTPDGRTVVGTPSYGDGYCADAIAALDARTGTLLRQWKGCFGHAVAEDDQHFLIVAVASGGGGDPGTKSAIIRCGVSTGQCERATPITVDQQLSLHR